MSKLLYLTTVTLLATFTASPALPAPRNQCGPGSNCLTEPTPHAAQAPFIEPGQCSKVAQTEGWLITGIAQCDFAAPASLKAVITATASCHLSKSKEDSRLKKGALEFNREKDVAGLAAACNYLARVKT